MNVDELYNFLEVMSYQVTDFLFGGIIDSYSTKSLIAGFESDLVDTVCPYDDMDDSDFFRGEAIFYDPYVTPVLTTQVGRGTSQSFQVSTGNGQDTYPNMIVSMNGYPYPNKIMSVWNGVSLVEVNYRCPG